MVKEEAKSKQALIKVDSKSLAHWGLPAAYSTLSNETWIFLSIIAEAASHDFIIILTCAFDNPHIMGTMSCCACPLTHKCHIPVLEMCFGTLCNIVLTFSTS